MSDAGVRAGLLGLPCGRRCTSGIDNVIQQDFLRFKSIDSDVAEAALQMLASPSRLVRAIPNSAPDTMQRTAP